MWTEAEEGDKIEVHECSSEREEADKIGNFVRKILPRGRYSIAPMANPVS